MTAELWPELVDRLCGRTNVRRVLAGLAHANAFVEESPGAPGGFRIHPLFREMLQAQLGYEHPAELARLHRMCAAWYADRGRPLEAVGHAVAGGGLGLRHPAAHRRPAGHPPARARQRPGPAGAAGAPARICPARRPRSIRTVAALAGGRRPGPGRRRRGVGGPGGGRPAHPAHLGRPRRALAAGAATRRRPRGRSSRGSMPWPPSSPSCPTRTCARGASARRC